MPREVGPWTKEKLRILAQYLPVYLQATTKAVERIYVDGFAGPGTNRIESTGEIVEGSPLIALGARSTNRTAFDRLFYIERDRKTASELREALSSRDSTGRAKVIEGDVNVELPKLVRELPKRSPTFVFLDTEGIEPRWETLSAIAPWQTELLINFPLGMAINRNPNSRKVMDYFGTDEWRPIWQSAETGRLRRLLDFYKGRLRDLGWRYTTDIDPLITATGGQQLYYLIFVSKIEPGKRIMKWVQEQPDARGQLQFRF
jgi:three-Cys-motif partner protein